MRWRKWRAISARPYPASGTGYRYDVEHGVSPTPHRLIVRPCSLVLALESPNVLTGESHPYLHHPFAGTGGCPSLGPGDAQVSRRRMTRRRCPQSRSRTVGALSPLRSRRGELRTPGGGPGATPLDRLGSSHRCHGALSPRRSRCSRGELGSRGGRRGAPPLGPCHRCHRGCEHCSQSQSRWVSTPSPLRSRCSRGELGSPGGGRGAAPLGSCRRCHGGCGHDHSGGSLRTNS